MDMLSAFFESGYGGVLGGLLGVVTFFVLLGVIRSFIKVTLPDKLLVITGKKKNLGGKVFGYSVERGRAVALPYFQNVNTLDLGVFPINVKVEGVNSANGITVGADATACICIDDDDEGMLYSAVERLMGKTRDEIQAQIQQTLIGNFRGALNKATPLQAIGMNESGDVEADPDPARAIEHGERAQFRNELLADINNDLASFGMKVVSVSLQKIWDTSNYLANLAQKTLAEKRQQVEIEEARLTALADKAESDSQRRMALAKALADEKILIARQTLEVYRRESEASLQGAKLEGEQAMALARNKGERQIQEKLVELQKIYNRSRVTLEAQAGAKAAEILAEGDKEIVAVHQGVKNTLLAEKAAILAKYGKAARTVVFLQQQLPHLFESFKSHAEGMKTDSLIVMDSETGFTGTVNRGPAAFVQFLDAFSKATGLIVQDLIGQQGCVK